MDIVLDSCCLHHLVRGGRGDSPDDVTTLVKERRLRIVVDTTAAIVDEWHRTAGAEATQALIIYWSELGGFIKAAKTTKLSGSLKKRLHNLGFTDTIDRVIVETAASTADRRVVTNDPDFWDPKNRASIGDRTAPVCAMLRKEESITVDTLLGFLQGHSTQSGKHGHPKERAGKR